MRQFAALALIGISACASSRPKRPPLEAEDVSARAQQAVIASDPSVAKKLAGDQLGEATDAGVRETSDAAVGQPSPPPPPSVAVGLPSAQPPSRSVLGFPLDGTPSDAGRACASAGAAWSVPEPNPLVPLPHGETEWSCSGIPVNPGLTNGSAVVRFCNGIACEFSANAHVFDSREFEALARALTEKYGPLTRAEGSPAAVEKACRVDGRASAAYRDWNLDSADRTDARPGIAKVVLSYHCIPPCGQRQVAPGGCTTGPRPWRILGVRYTGTGMESFRRASSQTVRDNL